jgi:DNA-binding CsgD family transcriptional regulator
MFEFAHAQAWSFIREASNYRDKEGLTEHFLKVLEAFGFDRFICLRSYDQGSPITLASARIEDWVNHYVDQGYFEVDPCRQWALAGRPEFSWAEARKWSERQGDPSSREAALWGDAAAAGMKAGLVFSNPGPSGHVLITRIMTGETLIRPVDRPILDCMAVMYSTMLQRLHEEAHEAPLNTLLTRREAECLRWASLGLTDVEIGERLALSARTVNNHIERAKRKLGASNRVAAYRRAMALGLLAA